MAQPTGGEWVSSPGVRNSTLEGFFLHHSLSKIKPFQYKRACRKQSMVLALRCLLSCDALTESYKTEREQSRSAPDPPRLHPFHSQFQALSSSALPPSPLPISPTRSRPQHPFPQPLGSSAVLLWALLPPGHCVLGWAGGTFVPGEDEAPEAFTDLLSLLHPGPPHTPASFQDLVGVP